MRRRVYGPDPEGQLKAAQIILQDPSKHPTFSERWAKRIVAESKSKISHAKPTVQLGLPIEEQL